MLFFETYNLHENESDSKIHVTKKVAINSTELNKIRKKENKLSTSLYIYIYIFVQIAQLQNKKLNITTTHCSV